MLFREQPSPLDPRDIEVEDLLNPTFELPKKVDHRGLIPVVWDQGSDGPCSAYSAAAIKQWQERKDYGLRKNLSRDFVYFLRSNKPQKGMYPRDTMKILQKYGIPLKKSFKKRKYNTIDDIPTEVMEEAAKHRIVGYARVNTIEGLKKSLYKNGPCYAVFPLYHNGKYFWKPEWGNNKQLGAHAVVIVGYDQYGFMVRNSWGDMWNEDGHTYYPYDQWGSHIEIWTCIDEKTGEPVIQKKRKNIIDIFKSIFKK